MSALKPGALLVTQDDVTCFQTGTVLIKKGAHLMYLQHVSSSARDFGHKVVDATTLMKFVLDPGVEIIDADGNGTLYVVRPRFLDLPIHACHVKEGVVRT